MALEFKAAFGPAALDDAVHRAIPDTHYQPGTLHRLLLKLPWSDVFTTNYDTLLERALPDVLERRYEVVVSVDDLPVRRQPRIFKLHGSMPDRRPYIITEEDYRTYPTKYAPFVNTVQQSLMENAFVLIGFSGTDPNFLQWIGWVRDRLPNAVHPVYLCGLLALSPAQRQVLRDLNVLSVDLTPLFPPGAPGTNDLRHRRALEWLLYSLANGAPPNTINWPTPDAVSSPQITNPEPLPRRRLLEPEIRVPTRRISVGEISAPTDPVSLPSVAGVWRRKRECYPGWVVLPTTNRTALRYVMEGWAREMADGVAELPMIEALSVAREFLWRLERLGYALDTSLAETLEGVVGAHPPEEILSAPELQPVYVRECWVEVAFSLARRGRQDGDDAFNRWMERLREVVEERPQWNARWYYEMCLYHLYRNDVAEVRALAARWPACDADPFWDARRAAVLAESGEIDEARTLASSALDRIRRQLHSDEEDVALLSREAWTMLLLSMLHDQGAFRDSNRGRWDQLARYRCNASAELESLRHQVERAQPQSRNRRRVWTDPFRGTRRRSYSLFSFDAAPRDGFALLMLTEDGAIPLQVGHTVAYLSEALRAARLIASSSPAWATNVFLRASESKESSAWFDRIRITLQRDEVDALSDLLVSTISASVAAVHSGSETNTYAVRQLESKPGILARLVFRLDREKIRFILAEVLGWLSVGAGGQRHLAYEGFDHLLHELLRAADTHLWSESLLRLLRFPIPGADGFAPVHAKAWPEPFLRVGLPPGIVVTDGPAVRLAAERLVQIAAGGSVEARTRAIIRLKALFHAGLLDSELIKGFADALWARVDAETGLPTETSLYAFGLLNLPEPEPGRAVAAVRSFLLRQDFVRQISGNVETGRPFSFLGTSQPGQLAREWFEASVAADPDEEDSSARIDWSPDEAHQLLNQLIEWWADQRGWTERGDLDPMAADELIDALEWIPDLVRRVIVPRVERASDAATAALTLLSDLAEHEIAPAAATTTALRLSSNLTPLAAEAIRAGLRASDSDAVADAASAVYRWSVGSCRALVPSPPPDLISELVARASARMVAGLESVLSWCTALVIHAPEVLDTNHLDALGSGLRRMIAETRLPTAGEQPVPDPDDPENDMVLLLPRIRAASARLAAAIVHSAQRIAPEGHSVVRVAEEWAATAEDEPLPEVRRALAGREV